MADAVLAIVCAGGDRLAQMLDRYLEEETEKLLVIDAVDEAELPADIARRVPDAELLVMAVDDDGPESELIRYSLPGLFSFRTAGAALEELFPGLRERGRTPVANLAGAALAERLAGYPDDITLVLSVPGEELRILTLLEQHGLLGRITAVHLRCGAEAYFSAATAEAGLHDWLSDRSFQLIHRDDADSAWPELSFLLDRHGQQLHALECRLEKAQGSLRESQQALQRAEQQLAQERKAAEAQQSALADHQKRLGIQAAELRKLRQQVQEHDEIADRARIGYERLRADQGTLLSLHKAQSEELSALRQKYARLFDEKRAQDELLQMLTPRLQQAARRLHALDLLPHDDAEELPEAPLDETEPGLRKDKLE